MKVLFTLLSVAIMLSGPRAFSASCTIDDLIDYAVGNLALKSIDAKDLEKIRGSLRLYITCIRKGNFRAAYEKYGFNPSDGGTAYGIRTLCRNTLGDKVASACLKKSFQTLVARSTTWQLAKDGSFHASDLICVDSMAGARSKLLSTAELRLKKDKSRLKETEWKLAKVNVEIGRLEKIPGEIARSKKANERLDIVERNLRVLSRSRSRDDSALGRLLSERSVLLGSSKLAKLYDERVSLLERGQAYQQDVKGHHAIKTKNKPGEPIHDSYAGAEAMTYFVKALTDSDPTLSFDITGHSVVYAMVPITASPRTHRHSIEFGRMDVKACLKGLEDGSERQSSPNHTGEAAQ